MQQTINGHTATLSALSHIAQLSYGAYTSFRVEEGRVRGLDLHLARLQRSATDLFGEALDEAELRVWMRTALAGRADAWMRVTLFSPHISTRDPTFHGRPDVLIGVSDAPSPLAGGLRLQARRYVREEPEHKHLAVFGLLRARRAARAAGFDDALFVGPDDLISEGTLWNIGFIQGDTVVWPQAPMLAGVTQALIAANLDMPQATRPVRLGELPSFDAAFICNSATPAASVAAIEGVAFAAPPSDRIAGAWRAADPHPI